jgi:hypothetical protein
MRRIVMVGSAGGAAGWGVCPRGTGAYLYVHGFALLRYPNRDNINERPAFGVRDEIYGRRGADRIDAGISPGDVDFVSGGRGGDRLITDDVPNDLPPDFEFVDDLDEARGGRGIDTCRVDEGDAYFNCEVVYIDGVLQP